MHGRAFPAHARWASGPNPRPNLHPGAWGACRRTACRRGPERTNAMETPFKAYDGNEPCIFVSYSHSDRYAVFNCLAHLATGASGYGTTKA